MKTILNIPVILVISVLVGGLFYGAVTLTSSGMDQTAFQERPTDDDFPTGGEFSPPDRDGFDDEVQIPVEMIKSFVIISIVVVVYLNITKYFGRKKIAIQVSS